MPRHVHGGKGRALEARGAIINVALSALRRVDSFKSGVCENTGSEARSGTREAFVELGGIEEWRNQILLEIPRQVEPGLQPNSI